MQKLLSRNLFRGLVDEILMASCILVALTVLVRIAWNLSGALSMKVPRSMEPQENI